MYESIATYRSGISLVRAERDRAIMLERRSLLHSADAVVDGLVATLFASLAPLAARVGGRVRIDVAADGAPRVMVPSVHGDFGVEVSGLYQTEAHYTVIVLTARHRIAARGWRALFGRDSWHAAGEPHKLYDSRPQAQPATLAALVSEIDRLQAGAPCPGCASA